jgi:hypothetical protein
MRSLVLVFACMCLALPAQAQQQGEPVRLKEVPNPTLLKGVMPDLPKGLCSRRGCAPSPFDQA